MSRRLELLLVALVLLLAAALRITELTRLPPGFSDEEITTLTIVEAVRSGIIASFYDVGDPQRGRAGLYGVVQAPITGIVGNGLLLHRILPAMCGLLSVALIYALGRRLFGKFAGLVAALTLSVSLWPILLSRFAGSEALLLPLIIAGLLAMARALHLRRRIMPDPPVTASYTMLGLFIALIAYTRWTGLAVFPLFLVFILYLLLTRQPISRRVIGFSAFTLLVATIIGIPYLGFTLHTPGLSGFNSFWVERPESVGHFLNATLQAIASVGIAGDPDPTHNLPGSPLIGPVAFLLLLVGVITAARRWRQPGNMLMLLALILGLLTDAWSRGEPNFAHMILALPAMLALTGLGAAVVVQYVRQIQLIRQPALFNAAVTVTTLAVVGISALLVTRTLLQDWAARYDIYRIYHGRLGYLAAYLDRVRDGLTTSICTYNLGREYATDAPAPAESLGKMPADPYLLDMMMHRSGTDLRFSNCLDALVLTRGGERQRFAYADPKAAETIAPLFAEWLGNARPVEVAGLSPGSVLEVDAEQAVADVFGQVIQAHAEWAPETAGPSDRAVLPLRMGGYLTFEGYRLLEPAPFQPGDMLHIATYWRADGQQVPGLRLFLHLMRNPHTPPILQNDILNVDTSRLRDRDVFVQIMTITLPEAFPSGSYVLSVGAYSATTGHRLPIYDENQERGNRLFLDKIAVGE